MKIVSIYLFASLTVVAWAQQSSTTLAAPSSKLYDSFNSPWLDQAKWVAVAPTCARTLECVREIQDGKLRLVLRNVGYSDVDSGDQFSYDELFFSNPAAVNSIETDVTVKAFTGAECSTNPQAWTHASVEIGGNYFNTGTGSPYDDVADIVALVVDPGAPKVVNVSNWLWGPNLGGVSTDMGNYPLGIPLTVKITWDPTNHRFTSSVYVKGDPGRGKQVAVPYYVSDVTPPAQLMRHLDAAVDTANCTTAQPVSQVEAFYDNVKVK